jgi:hypothetical protein
MDNLTVQKLKELISKNQHIAVVVKKNPTLDQMAAGLGLFLILKQMNKQAVIASDSDIEVALSSLVGIDKVQQSFSSGEESPMSDLIVSFPYREGEIDKVSYTQENNMLNIILKAGEKGLNFTSNDVQFKRSGAASLPTLIFYVGVSTPDEAGGLMVSDSAVTIVNIDNDATNQKFGQVPVVDTRWSSVSEQIADFVTLLEPQIEVDADTAQNLLNGILFATDDFKSPNTSYLAFEVAGILMKKGATRAKAQAVIAGSSSPAVPNVQSFFPQPTPQQIPIVQQPVTLPNASQFAQQQMPPVAPQQPVVEQPVVPQSQPSWTPPSPSAPTIITPQETSPHVQSTEPMSHQPVPPPQEHQQQPTQQPQTPPDWLTPKVYKGSTVL